nr:MAG TPA: hypothetical protein [Caudoviricetes sp.]
MSRSAICSPAGHPQFNPMIAYNFNCYTLPSSYP